MSDIHYDSLKCDRKLLKKHLDEAVEKDAGIVIAGDLFDVMGSEKDPRSKANEIRSEYIVQGMSYLDCVTQDMHQFLKPYIENIMVIGYGNHETAIKKHNETDPIETLRYLFKQQGVKHFYTGGYSGYINLRFTRYGGDNQAFKVKYHHGGGGNAPRSKGTLRVDLRAAKWPDADIVVTGHDHNMWHMRKVREKLDRNNVPYEASQHHISLGSYKKLGDGYGGWSVEKEHERKPRGSYWANFTMEARDVKLTVTEAK